MAAFQVDEDKLRQGLPPPVSTAGDDAKWTLAFFGTFSLVAAVIVGIIALLLSALL